MKRAALTLVRFLFVNWKTSSVGLLIAVALVLWILRDLTTDGFLIILAYAASVGFFILNDPAPPTDDDHG